MQIDDYPVFKVENVRKHTVIQLRRKDFKGKQFATLKNLMHRTDISEVVNACDAGREGELIFRFVYEVAGCKKPRLKCAGERTAAPR